jgi:hypothetical protein
MNPRGARVAQLAPVAVAGIVVLAYGWWFTDREPFSPGAFRALVVAVVVLLIAAVVQRMRRGRRAAHPATRGAPHFWAAVVVWSLVVVAVVAWELISLRSLPRSAHPTISSMVEASEHHHVVRLAFYALWVWFGWALAT